MTQDDLEMGSELNTTIDITVLLEDFLESSTEHLDALESALMVLEKDSAGGRYDQTLISHLLGNLHTMKGNSGMMGFTSLQQFIHKLESSLKTATERLNPLSPVFFEAFYTAITAMRTALRKLADNPAEPLDFSDEQMLLECLSVDDAEMVDGSLPAWKKDDSSNISQKSSTLKVNFQKLDELMNLVGELVVHRTALLSLESRLKEAIKDRELIEAYNEAGQLIGKTANDLREAIMKVRMLPIKSVFHRFNRLVRDLSQRHGKEIHLEFEGEETELDKTVIDEIGEPLLHLIRNSIDHGIESPDERIRQGKSPTGILRLIARHQSNAIVIIVEDDGCGISADKIKESAVAKGLLERSEVSNLTEQEALQLIFIPGFSTSMNVTETSGRGIGLDVVNTTMKSLNGTVEIESLVGTGTRFVIKLPLTLAIINALMVEAAGEKYAIPLSGVIESIKVHTSEIHEMASGEILQLRDRLLPIIRLDRFFGRETTVVREDEYIVVVENGEKRSGIVVERLVGQQEIVIKGMDDYLGELPGISGGTVLGDGRISLILDIASLISTKKIGGTIYGK